MKKIKEKIEDFWYMNEELLISAVILSIWGCVCMWGYNNLAAYLNSVFG